MPSSIEHKHDVSSFREICGIMYHPPPRRTSTKRAGRLHIPAWNTSTSFPRSSASAPRSWATSKRIKTSDGRCKPTWRTSISGYTGYSDQLQFTALQMGDLPIAPGSSGAFKRRVEEEIAAFKERWDWIISPLVIAVALEVVVRPECRNATSSAARLGQHRAGLPFAQNHTVVQHGHRSSLDNRLYRTLPTRSQTRGPVGPNPTPPPGTKQGVTRYEAWRLPPVAGEAGFVSVALVADMDARGDKFDRIDEWASKWADAQSGASGKRRRR